MLSQKMLACYTVAFVIILAIGLGLFGSSFAVVNLNTAALLKNKFTLTLDSNTVYEPGR